MSRNKEFDQVKVIEGALTLFWEKGYYKTSIQDLVDFLGIGRGSLYNTYGSKYNLFLMALERYTENRNRQIRQQLSLSPVKEAFEAFMINWVDEMIMDANLKGCFIVNTMTEMASEDGLVKKLLTKSDVQLIECFEEALQHGVEQGEMSPMINLHHLALFLSITLKGLRVRAKIVSDREELIGAVELALLAFDA